MTNLFEARRLKSYSEPVSKEDLREGEVYFFVNFNDEQLLIPTMEPFVYAGRNLELGDDNQVYFQDVRSFTNGIRYDTARDGDDAVFHTGSEDELGHVFDYEHALDQLLACSLRRKKSAGSRR
jgi:hypothetical protein